MNEKLNIAEILKDCPKGMELDCTCADNVVFDKIIEYDQIKCVIGECRDPLILDKYGRLLHICCPKCVIFPKGKTTWEGFQRPFKDGDVLVGKSNQPFIFKKLNNSDGCFSYCGIDRVHNFHLASSDWTFANSLRFATEEEKQKLFNAIKDNGYKWNAETKTLEKLIEPKFKVGDRIQWDSPDYRPIRVIKSLECDRYRLDNGNYIKFGEEGAYKLLKFDITTLKPFDKVLVRDCDENEWISALYERYIKTEDNMNFATIVGRYQQCIPYEGNEHLLGTTNDCDDYYKTWK